MRRLDTLAQDRTRFFGESGIGQRGFLVKGNAVIRAEQAGADRRRYIRLKLPDLIRRQYAGRNAKPGLQGRTGFRRGDIDFALDKLQLAGRLEQGLGAKCLVQHQRNLPDVASVRPNATPAGATRRTGGESADLDQLDLFPAPRQMPGDSRAIDAAADNKMFGHDLLPCRILPHL